MCEGIAYSGVASLPPRTKADATARLRMQADRLWQLVISAVPASVSDNLFKSPKEWDHFQFFIRMGTPYETLPSGSLQILTPQVAHIVPAVKEICCAVGALSKTITASGDTLRQALVDSDHHYSQAAALLRSVVPTNDNLLTVCVASLMFSTYEMLSRQPEVAFSHFIHSYLMFEQYLAKRAEDAAVHLSELVLTELERAISDTLQRMGTYPWTEKIDHVETPTTDSQLMSCCKGQLHTSLLLRMPSSFESMTTAAQWWDATQHFIMHHSHQGRTGGAAEQKMWSQCVDTLHRWHATFYPRLEQSRREYHADQHRKADEYLHGIMLETLYLECLGSISNYRLEDANILPDTKPLFREMITITRLRLPSYGPFTDENISVEKFLLRPLAYVLVKCDAPDLKEEIHELIKSIKNPGHITRALLSILSMEANAFGSAMAGWMWDFLTSGCAAVSLTTESEERKLALRPKKPGT